MGEMIEFVSNGSTAGGYLATPESGGGPGVIVIQEWWGLVDHIEAVCDRFAAAGFVALAPDLHHGKKGPRGEPDEAGRALWCSRRSVPTPWRQSSRVTASSRGRTCSRTTPRCRRRCWATTPRT